MGAAEKLNNRLPDGRQIRALDRTFNQRQMFALHKSGLFVPKRETIMSVKEHDQSIHSGAYRSVNPKYKGWWRTGEYSFYPRGFENDIPFGEQIVYVEKRRGYVGLSYYTLNIPDVAVKLPNGDMTGLRQAIGMGIIKLEKLELEQKDENRWEVSVTSDFDPETDLKVVDVVRERNRSWGVADSDGYPLRSNLAPPGAPGSRQSVVRYYYDFWTGSTGYHGCVSREVLCRSDFGNMVVSAAPWFDSSLVALVECPVTRLDEVRGAHRPTFHDAGQH